MPFLFAKASMIQRMWPVVLLALLAPVSATAAHSRAAVDRGNLSLAWDAHESGLFSEALGYLDEIPADSPAASEAVWLRAECLYDLGRYAEAARVLNTEPGRSLADRADFLFDVYWGWAWEATGREDYAGALHVIQSALAALPADDRFVALGEATRFRQRLAKAMAEKRGRLSSGEEISIRPADAPAPESSGWQRAYPWAPQLPRVPQYTLSDWMPRRAAELDRQGRALWIRISAPSISREAEREAKRGGLTASREPSGVLVDSKGEKVFLDQGEWSYRAAAEGLGIRGAALLALAEARNSAGQRAALVSWVADHRGNLGLERSGDVLRLKSAVTGRTFDLDSGVWADEFSPDSAEWTDFWQDLTEELDRPARPFRCFCGREVQLRETLVADPGPFVPVEKGRGFAIMVVALCPLHQQFVTPELLKSWGVGWKEVRERARADAVANPWDLAFERGVAQGSPYVVLEGEGASGLARRPELLLGALEALDGIGARGRSVSVVVPSTSALVISSGSERAAEAGAARALLAAGRRGEAVSRLSYRATVRLPEAGLGSFRLRPAE